MQAYLRSYKHYVNSAYTVFVRFVLKDARSDYATLTQNS